MKLFYCFLVLCLLPFFSTAQNEEIKKEFENPIEHNQLPDNIYQKLKPLLKKATELHYYHEYTAGHEFYEVKLCYEDRHWSIEFEKEGELLDVEELLSWGDLPEALQRSLKTYFNQNYKRWKITRLQKQFSGWDFQKVFEALRQNKTKALTVRYELEANVSGDSDGDFGAYEFLFDNQGHLQNKRKIVQRDTDHVTY